MIECIIPSTNQQIKQSMNQPTNRPANLCAELPQPRIRFVYSGGLRSVGSATKLDRGSRESIIARSSHSRETAATEPPPTPPIYFDLDDNEWVGTGVDRIAVTMVTPFSMLILRW